MRWTKADVTPVGRGQACDEQSQSPSVGRGALGTIFFSKEKSVCYLGCCCTKWQGQTFLVGGGALLDPPGVMTFFIGVRHGLKMGLQPDWRGAVPKWSSIHSSTVQCVTSPVE